ncbi:unnamed protein product [Effrenium voratum]|nr:unnamed protein product [Effrenium voratum]
MQRVRQRRKLGRAKPNLTKEKAALVRIVGEKPQECLPARETRETRETPGSGGTAVERLRENLDAQSRGSRPCPMDSSKCAFELRLGQDTVHFPFAPMPPQEAVASYVLKACERAGIAMLQSPTGTGKSLALLCAALAWQRRQSLETGAAPQVVYGVRTHAQIKQIVGELRKSGYRPRMAVIGSREQLCANETVKSQARMQQVPLNLACRSAARAACAGSGGCGFYTGLAGSRYAQRVFDRCGAGQPWDVEDLISTSATGAEAGCPYYTAHILAGDADLVFCPHNYILDPSVSQCRSHHRERWSLKGRVIILDEAHNLEQCCREAGSLEVSVVELRQISRTIAQMPLRHEGFRFGERRSCAQAATELERLPLQLANFLASQSAGQQLWGLSSPTRDFLRQAGLTRGLLSKSLEDLALEATDRLLQAQLANEAQGRADDADAELLSALEKLRDVVFKLRLVFQHPDSYVVGIAGSRLSLWLMSPGVLFEVFAGPAHAVLLASGTLDSSALLAELADSPALSRALAEGPLEAMHVVQPWQLLASVVPCFSNGQPIVSTFGSWQSEDFVQELGESILKLVQPIPGGVLVFLPSYQSLELCAALWRRAGLLARLAEVKTVILEPRGGGQLQAACASFVASVRNGPGALCLAVYRGKMSEGLDFADDLCRAVICVGVPYPQMNDAVVLAKRQWNDAKRASSRVGLLSGDQWYELQAHRAVNQALGRLLRHSRDYGALLLLDARWAQHGSKARNLRRQLSSWLRHHVRESPGDVCGRLRQHFEEAQRLLAPAVAEAEPQLPRKRRLVELLRGCSPAKGFPMQPMIAALS